MKTLLHETRVGIPLIGGRHWLGGITYVEALARAVTSLADSERPRLYLIVQPETLPHLPLHKTLIPLFDGVVTVGACPNSQWLQGAKNVIRLHNNHELAECIDFRYPIQCGVLPDICSGSWIPDFQHVRLPEFFSREEIALRTRLFTDIAEQARMIVLSSRDALKDFKRLYPLSKATLRILHFHSAPGASVFANDPDALKRKYNLPNDYLICCNQFWKHKNHLLLFMAVAILKKRGLSIRLVCTGSTEDYRHPDYFPSLMKQLQQLGIEDQVQILGMIPRDDQLQLIRGAQALIQPSLFEGWSTVVEDGRSLGKIMILSDLAVHREQDPNYAEYFNPYSANHLADTLEERLTLWSGEPNLKRESQVQIESAQRLREFGNQFCSIVMEAHFLFSRKIRGMNDAIWQLLSDPEIAANVQENI